MQSFRLLKLPHLAVEKVIDNLGIAELIDFSLCSKKCTTIVKSRKPVFTSIDICVQHCCRELSLKKGEKQVTFWGFSSGLVVEDLRRFTRYRNINGAQMRFDNQNERKSWCYHPNYESASIKFVEFLKGIFKCSIGIVRIRRHQVQEFQPLITLIRNCNHLDLTFFGVQSENDYRFFLETMESTKSAKIFWKNNRDFEFQNNQIFKCDHLEIGSTWITLHQIINMDLSTALIRYTKLSESDMLSLVRNWLNSGNLKLKWLEIEAHINFLENRNYEDIPVTRFLEDHRGKVYQLPHKQLDCSNGMDIRRQDGIRATIIYEMHVFHFVVWHE